MSADRDANSGWSLAARVWRLVPGRLRRFGVRLFEPTFTVTAGVVVLNDRGQVLFARHVFRTGSGWGIPGGFVERGEQPEDAARRELLEELDLEVADLRLAFVRMLRLSRQLEVLFTARAESAPRAAGGEIVDIAWLDPAALPDNIGPDQRALVRRALEFNA